MQTSLRKLAAWPVLTLILILAALVLATLLLTTPVLAALVPSTPVLPSAADTANTQVLHAAAPVYPELARRARLTGDVVIEMTLSDDGRVSGITAIRAHALLRDPAKRAALQWRFSTVAPDYPLRTFQATFQFRLVNRSAPEAGIVSSFDPPNSIETRATYMPLDTQSGTVQP